MNIVLSSTAEELYYIEDKIPGQVSFELEDTQELDTMADAIRQRYGYIPFFDETGSDIWTNGWYDFYLLVDVFDKSVISIQFNVKGNEADEETCPDNEFSYYIDDYVEIDRDDILKQLVAELRKKYHTSLDEIEKEVREYV